MSEHAGGMFIAQFKNWSILLSDFPSPARENLMQANLSISAKNKSRPRPGSVFSRRLPAVPQHAILLKNAKGAHGMSEKLRLGPCFEQIAIKSARDRRRAE